MNIYVLSDNKFFLFGITHCEKYLDGCEGKVFPIFSENVSGTFKPIGKDAVVVIFISSTVERNRITAISALHECRVLMLVKTTGKQEYSSPSGRLFPWIVPYDLGIADLFLYVIKARSTPFYRRYFTCTEALLFHLLAEGISVQEMVILDLTCKYLYALKRKVILKNKIYGNDTIAIMICRDVIALSSLARVSNCFSSIN